MTAAAQRAQPFYCPYCGEQDLRPDEEPGGWHCQICDRRYTLAHHGLRGHDDRVRPAPANG